MPCLDLKYSIGGWKIEVFDGTTRIQLCVIWNNSLGSWEFELFGSTGHTWQCFSWYSLPTEIGLLNGLAYLNVWDNVLNETLPSEIGLLTNLQYLILDGNQLSGPLPTEILQLTNLIHLELSGNRFNEELLFHPCDGKNNCGNDTDNRLLSVLDNMGNHHHCHHRRKWRCRCIRWWLLICKLCARVDSLYPI